MTFCTTVSTRGRNSIQLDVNCAFQKVILVEKIMRFICHKSDSELIETLAQRAL